MNGRYGFTAKNGETVALAARLICGAIRVHHRVANIQEWSDPMAKGQQRSNREKKKPKQSKDKPAAAATTFSAQLAKSSSLPGKKK